MPMITPRSFISCRLVAMAAFLGVFAAAADAQTLLSHYKLDGNGTDSGTLGIAGTLNNDAAFTTSGAGVNNYNEALSTSNGTDDYFSAATGGNAALGLNAITIALWVNIDSAASTDRLVSNISSNAGFDLYIQNYAAGAGGVDTYNLAFGFNSTSGAVQSADPKYVTDKWLFIAVTYDSATSTVSFYSGDQTTGVSLNDTAAKTGSIAASALNLEIGGTPVTGSDRSPTALFNDVRIYNGVLGLSELEAVRYASIPEPSHYAAIFGALSLAALVVRSRRVRRQASE